MNTAHDTATVARKLDGVLLIFQRYDDLWMIDRVSEPANERGDEECYEEPDGSTAVARAELSGLSEVERRHFHARQLRRLGLPERGHGSKLLWAMISDFERFAP